MNIRDFLCKFKNAKRSGSGWTARSPAHDDQHNSLSIGEGEGGRVLLYCRARCSTTQVCDALGIELKDLMSAPTMRAMKRGAEARIVKSYEYTDETGTLLYQNAAWSLKASASGNLMATAAMSGS